MNNLTIIYIIVTDVKIVFLIDNTRQPVAYHKSVNSVITH